MASDAHLTGVDDRSGLTIYDPSILQLPAGRLQVSLTWGGKTNASGRTNRYRVNPYLNAPEGCETKGKPSRPHHREVGRPQLGRRYQRERSPPRRPPRLNTTGERAQQPHERVSPATRHNTNPQQGEGTQEKPIATMRNPRQNASPGPPTRPQLSTGAAITSYG